MRFIYELTEEQHESLARHRGVFEQNGDLNVSFPHGDGRWSRVVARRVVLDDDGTDVEVERVKRAAYDVKYPNLPPTPEERARQVCPGHEDYQKQILDLVAKQPTLTFDEVIDTPEAQRVVDEFYEWLGDQ